MRKGKVDGVWSERTTRKQERSSDGRRDCEVTLVLWRRVGESGIS